jgi:hypothetical protein
MVTVPAIWKGPQGPWWIGICNACHKPVLVLGDGFRIYPTPLPSPSDPYIPDPIRDDLDEAKTCHTVSAWRACAVLARRAIQAAALHKAATGAKLADQIADLAAKGVITSDLRECADVVRWVGNDAAHPDGDKVSQQDAEDVLHLAEQFLHVVYVTPAKARALRKARGK